MKERERKKKGEIGGRKGTGKEEEAPSPPVPLRLFSCLFFSRFPTSFPPFPLYAPATQARLVVPLLPILKISS